MEIAGEVQIEIVLEGLAGNGTGLDFCQVQAVKGKAPQHLMQCARGVGQGEAQANFVGVLGQAGGAADNDKPGAVVSGVLDVFFQYRQAVFFGGFSGADDVGLRTDRGRAV